MQTGRKEAADIIHRRDDRLLVVVGPKSVRNANSTVEYGILLQQVAERLQNDLCVVMRCNVEKPRDLGGSKGFIGDPHCNGTYEINEGLRKSRELFIRLTHSGIPLATEIVGALTPLYLAELMSVSPIGSYMIESPLYRELASGAPFPVGFHASKSGDESATVDFLTAASTEHQFISITPEGRVAIAWTPGNSNCFIIQNEEIESSELPQASQSQSAVETVREELAVMINISTGMRHPVHTPSI